MKTVFFTRAKLNELQAKYDKARMENHEEFQFEGQTVLVCYAKYLIEFLNTQLQPKPKHNEHTN
jgi:dTDP-4-amino-4,6-dideoxygalactose transaminase